MKKTKQKPPMGVMPQKLWLEDRIQELTRVMHEYARINNFEPLQKWLCELEQRLIDREEL